MNPYSHKTEQPMHVQEVNNQKKKRKEKAQCFYRQQQIHHLSVLGFPGFRLVLFMFCHLVDARLQSRLVNEALCCCYLLQPSWSDSVSQEAPATSA